MPSLPPSTVKRVDFRVRRGSLPPPTEKVVLPATRKPRRRPRGKRSSCGPSPPHRRRPRRKSSCRPCPARRHREQGRAASRAPLTAVAHREEGRPAAMPNPPPPSTGSNVVLRAAYRPLPSPTEKNVIPRAMRSPPPPATAVQIFTGRSKVGSDDATIRRQASEQYFDYRSSVRRALLASKSWTRTGINHSKGSLLGEGFPEMAANIRATSPKAASLRRWGLPARAVAKGFAQLPAV